MVGKIPKLIRSFAYKPIIKIASRKKPLLKEICQDVAEFSHQKAIPDIDIGFIGKHIEANFTLEKGKVLVDPIFLLFSKMPRIKFDMAHEMRHSEQLATVFKYFVAKTGSVEQGLAELNNWHLKCKLKKSENPMAIVFAIALNYKSLNITDAGNEFLKKSLGSEFPKLTEELENDAKKIMEADEKYPNMENHPTKANIINYLNNFMEIDADYFADLYMKAGRSLKGK